MTALLTSLLSFISVVLLVQFEFSWYWFAILVAMIIGAKITDVLRIEDKGALWLSIVSSIQKTIRDLGESTSKDSENIRSSLFEIKQEMYHLRPTHNVNSKMEKELTSITCDIKNLESSLSRQIDTTNSSLHSITIALLDIIPEKPPFDDMP